MEKTTSSNNNSSLTEKGVSTVSRISGMTQTEDVEVGCSTSGTRRSISGEIFPGRRCSIERNVAMITSSSRVFLGVPYRHDMRRASLQSIDVRPPTPDRASGSRMSSRGELTTVGVHGSVPRLRISPRGSADLGSTANTSLGFGTGLGGRETRDGFTGRRMSCVAGALMSTHVTSARIREPTIFNIGSDYMKVSI